MSPGPGTPCPRPTPLSSSSLVKCLSRSRCPLPSSRLPLVILILSYWVRSYSGRTGPWNPLTPDRETRGRVTDGHSTSTRRDPPNVGVVLRTSLWSLVSFDLSFYVCRPWPGTLSASVLSPGLAPRGGGVLETVGTGSGRGGGGCLPSDGAEGGTRGRSPVRVDRGPDSSSTSEVSLPDPGPHTLIVRVPRSAKVCRRTCERSVKSVLESGYSLRFRCGPKSSTPNVTLKDSCVPCVLYKSPTTT